jgi:hypothetical protein
MANIYGTTERIKNLQEDVSEQVHATLFYVKDMSLGGPKAIKQYI